jgi:DNA-binding NarL/FixJ family response regulator
MAARVIAAADVRQALSQLRPHRPPFSADDARRQLLAEVDSGKLDRDAVKAVLEPEGLSAGIREKRPHGLTDREVEVLRLLCRGLTNKEMARALYIAEKTVGHHIEHIYNKIGHSSRAGAALFAMEHGIVG